MGYEIKNIYKSKVNKISVNVSFSNGENRTFEFLNDISTENIILAIDEADASWPQVNSDLSDEHRSLIGFTK